MVRKKKKKVGIGEIIENIHEDANFVCDDECFM